MMSRVPKISIFDSPFPGHVSFFTVHQTQLACQSPHPAELKVLSGREAPERRDSFALGRIAARLALKRLLPEPPPILSGDDGAPCWPDGIVGSISHSGEWGVAAVDRASRSLSLGIDLEHLQGQVDLEIATLVADAEELRWIDANPRRLLALFSAKESVFKALYPHCRMRFDFDAVTARWSEDPNPGFDMTLLQPIRPWWPVGSRLRVGVRWLGSSVLTWTRISSAEEDLTGLGRGGPAALRS